MAPKTRFGHVKKKAKTVNTKSAAAVRSPPKSPSLIVPTPPPAVVPTPPPAVVPTPPPPVIPTPPPPDAVNPNEGDEEELGSTDSEETVEHRPNVEEEKGSEEEGGASEEEEGGASEEEDGGASEEEVGGGSEEEDGAGSEEEDGAGSEEEDGGGSEDEAQTADGQGESAEEGSEHTDTMEETGAIPPMGMYFPPSEYNKKIKISTRCFLSEVLHTLNSLKPKLNDMERSWFENHPQFKHMFHMPKDGNHKVMGMWMCLLRTVRIERKKEAWFAVNGTPIRYGIREHALISGLNCKNYNLHWKEKGSLRFVNKYFGEGVTVRHQDIKPLLLEMEPSTDRLKMAVLYFLSSVIICHTKVGKDAPSVEPFFLRAVDDLNLCKTFPWGRMSFEHMLKEISHTMDHFGGVVKGSSWAIPGFCLPMELLAFEAIPDLRLRFREPYPEAHASCPKMCKSRFKKSEMRGFPLSSIYEALGTTKDIESILVPMVGEERLLHKILEKEDDIDVDDYVVESWLKRFKEGYRVFFEEMYKEDVATRETVDNPALPALTAGASSSNAQSTQLDDVVALITSLKAEFQGRIELLEEQVKELRQTGEKRKRSE